MTTAPSLPADTLTALADAETQRATARLAQDVFAGVFRQAFTPDPEQLGKILSEFESRCIAWCQAGESDDSRLLRLALLITGLDQWGLAYTQAFNLNAIPALTALIAALRSRLNAQSDALFQQYFTRLEAVETDGVDFKVELRRSLHLALWHAMVACETSEEAQDILRPLGSMLLALDRQMPELGWRLVADALAHIQISLLGEMAAATEVAQDSTQQLFGALRQALPAERYQSIVRHSGQVLLAWQQLRRSGEPH
ncbi:MAG TPA: hypothetical protein VJ572_01565 [Azonexus sp.]|nr:hypothetical protein [Azonexus sp.]